MLLWLFACSPETATTTGDVESAEVSGMLAAHNQTREALGLTPLTTSTMLEDVSGRWLDTLVADNCRLEHDPNTPYGENLFWTSSTATPAIVVGAWVDEVADYDLASNTCEPGRMCGHYTQVVWSSTERVGCAVRACDANGGELWICRYDPPGNFIGERPY